MRSDTFKMDARTACKVHQLRCYDHHLWSHQHCNGFHYVGTSYSSTLVAAGIVAQEVGLAIYVPHWRLVGIPCCFFQLNLLTTV
jgi:hypothetical protein